MLRGARYDRWKRVIDVSASGVLLAIVAPVLALVALVVRRSLGSPVLFRQVRPGRGGEPFTLYKFRTMRDDRDTRGELLSDPERTTSVGRFLRSTSLDELPELLNVLRGDMSLVGPRPLLVQYLPLYTPAQARRHEVRPGITGLTQVSGRNALTWEEKFDLDVKYVDNRSLALDVEILLRTVASVVRRDGITPDDAAAMPNFTGTPPDSAAPRAEPQ